eukprot:Gb_01190 [translate_table: standard]
MLPLRLPKSPLSSSQVSTETASLKPKPQHDGVMKAQWTCKAPFSVIQSISVQKLTPEYKVGMDPWALDEFKGSPPMRASVLQIISKIGTGLHMPIGAYERHKNGVVLVLIYMV